MKILLFLSLLACFLFPSSVFAQAVSGANSGSVSFGISRTVQINDKNVQDGDLISTTQDGNILSNISYDSQVIGVVSLDAAIVLSTDQTSGYPVVAEGSAPVLVSTKNGAIKTGDLLATSTIPGVAVKATASGYVIGTAQEDYDNPDPSKAGKISVDLNLHYFNSKPTFPGSLSDIFKIALLSTREGPSAIFKYIVAALVIIGSLVLGFLSFARTAAKGVEALGRNPAASRIIHFGIILNVGITGLIVVSGFGIAFLIIRL